MIATQRTGAQRLARVVRTGGAKLAQRLFLDRQLELWGAALDDTWALRDVRARVVEILEETRDTRTFVLQPNRNWRGHVAGQYVPVDVEIDGVRVRRCYSLSSAPGGSRIAITVKRVPGGRVSGWLHENLGAGAVLRIGPAAGEFVLPVDGEAAAAGRLFVTGGSGITPVMAMLRALDQKGAIEDSVLVHFARSRADVIFAAELKRLAARHRGLRLFVRLDDQEDGGFDEERLAQLVPDFAQRATFLCGPAPLMARVERMYETAGASARLKCERFGLVPSPTAAPDATAAEASSLPPSVDTLRVEVRLASGRRFAANRAAPLLDQLERAGVEAPYGCRMGICHTCKCTKRSGTVQNTVTGAISSDPDEEIQLCISVPRSDVELGL